jgi:solute:Na+ symporter, SSS family
MENPNTAITSVSSEIGAIDVSIIILYILGIVALGCWAGIRNKKAHAATKANDYFLAGSSLKWPVIGLALFATNISTVHLVSLAQSGFDFGLAYGNFEWMAVFTLLILALFFAPFFVRAKVATC